MAGASAALFFSASTSASSPPSGPRPNLSRNHGGHNLGPPDDAPVLQKAGAGVGPSVRHAAINNEPSSPKPWPLISNSSSLRRSPLPEALRKKGLQPQRRTWRPRTTGTSAAR